eukprot:g15989.t1
MDEKAMVFIKAAQATRQAIEACCVNAACLTAFSTSAVQWAPAARRCEKEWVPEELKPFLQAVRCSARLYTSACRGCTYKEYRKRLNLYHKKMVISKRAGESVLNILGSFSGVTWKLFEDYPVEDVEKSDAFSKILEKLDKNFEYDDRVLLPNDFEEFFNLIQRKPQQSLLTYVTEFDTSYRKLMAHNVSLPGQVQGWHLLRRAALTKEQRQMVTLKAPTLEKQAVIDALYLLFGQDYKAGGWNNDRDRKFARWKGRGYAAYEDDDYAWPSDTAWPDESVYYEADEWGPDDYNPDEDESFDYDAIYYGEEEPTEDHGESTEDPYELAEQYDHAYATYLDARQRFQQLKLARGYLPVVALTDGQSSPMASSPSNKGKDRSPSKGKSKSKNKGKGKNVIRYPPNTGGKAADPRAFLAQLLISSW